MLILVRQSADRSRRMKFSQRKIRATEDQSPDPDKLMAMTDSLAATSPEG
jgi:hypothetical protein